VSAKTQENCMERELFRAIKAALRRLGRRRRNRRFVYTDATIVEVYYWSVINDRPVVWACQQENWPDGLRRGLLPSQSEVSRRLRTAEVRRLIDHLEQLVLRQGRSPALVYLIDGKPLPISGHSRDPHAGYGRAASCMARGYKLHVVIDLNGTVWCWRVAPMNADERTIGRRLVRDLPGEGYLLGDANYDSNVLHATAGRVGVQMVTPRRDRGGANNLGHQVHHPGRLRSRDMLENRVFDFGRQLHTLRARIERFLGTLSATGGGLTHLPPWARGHRRVQRWIQAKLLLNQIRADRRKDRLCAI
jgi:hypothetical protein